MASGQTDINRNPNEQDKAQFGKAQDPNQMKSQNEYQDYLWAQDQLGKWRKEPEQQMIRDFDTGKRDFGKSGSGARGLRASGFGGGEQACDESDPEYAYINVQNDPRYQRLKMRLAPDWSKQGVMQRVRNYIDPSHIPYFGTFVHAYRGGKRKDTETVLENVQKGTFEGEQPKVEEPQKKTIQHGNSFNQQQQQQQQHPQQEKPMNQLQPRQQPQQHTTTTCPSKALPEQGSVEEMALEQSLKEMRINAAVEATKEKTSAATSVFFWMFPINTILPVEDVAAKVVGFGAKTAAKKVATKHERSKGEKEDEKKLEEQGQTSNENTKREEEKEAMHKVVDKWGATKAFILYLGYPKTDDPVYELWESSRLKLKELYGGKAEMDYWKAELSDNKDLKKQIESHYKSDEPFDLRQMNISLLELLWVVYECDSLPYYQRVLQRPNRLKERAQDERVALQMQHPISENVIRLEKCHVPAIVNLLQPKNAETPRATAIFGDKVTDKNTESMRWILTELTQYWLKKQEIWGYIDKNNDNRLEACVFWEPPENGESSLRWLLMKDSAKGFFKMGPRAYYHLVEKFQHAQSLTNKEATNRKATSIIHYFCVDRTIVERDMEKVCSELLYAVCEFVSSPCLAVLHKDEDLTDTSITRKYLEKLGFFETTEHAKEKEKEGLIVLRREKPGIHATMKPWENKLGEKTKSDMKQKFEEKQFHGKDHEKETKEREKELEKQRKAEKEQPTSAAASTYSSSIAAPAAAPIEKHRPIDSETTGTMPEKRLDSEKKIGSV